MSAPTLSVAILLSTFNGDRYLREQVASLFAQSYRNLRIYVRDDGSTDRTLEILEELDDERLEVTSDGLGRLGPGASFLQLLASVRADVYCFCDQDDYWLPEKVQQAVTAIAAAGANEPLLFHTDLTLVDSDLNSLGVSFNAHEEISVPSDYEFSRMLIQNCVVGCTIALTDALVEKARIRESSFQARNVAMHDWWMALCALSFGRVLFSNGESILYRQHVGNASGVSVRRSPVERFRTLLSFNAMRRIASYRSRIGRQAKYFAEMYEDALNPQHVRMLRGVAQLNEGKGIGGLLFCLRNRVVFKRFYMNCALVYVTLISLVYRKNDFKQIAGT